MKITASRPALADALNWVAQAIAKKPLSPVMSGLKITASGDRLHLAAFDYEVSHEAFVTADVASEGECLVSAAFMRSIVAKMRAKDVELVLDDDTLTVRSGRSAYSTRVLKLGDYPSLPKTPPKVGSIDASDLLGGLGVVVHPIDDGSVHEQVRGLRIEADEDLELVGMDRFRIATAALPWDGEKVALTVPSKAFHAAAKGMNGAVEIGASESAVGLTDEHRRVTIRLYEAGYTPLWRQMLAPVPNASTAVLDAAEFSDAVKRAGTLASEVLWIGVAFRDGELHIDVDGAEVGSGTDVLEAETTGEASGFLRPDHLAAALDVVPSGRVRVSRLAAGKPWQINPIDHPSIRLAVMGKAKS
jgi:DNA polymerase-3 subunit beta